MGYGIIDIYSIILENENEGNLSKAATPNEIGFNTTILWILYMMFSFSQGLNTYLEDIICFI